MLACCGSFASVLDLELRLLQENKHWCRHLNYYILNIYVHGVVKKEREQNTLMSNFGASMPVFKFPIEVVLYHSPPTATNCTFAV